MSLRDYLILEYAEVLQNNTKHSAFWRMVCDYLSAAGEEGRNRLRTHILHVSLGLPDLKGKGRAVDSADTDAVPNGNGHSGTMDVEEAIEAESVEARFEHFAELRETCIELRLEDEWKMISRIMADRLIRRGEYGIAATMCLQAEDGFALSQIADRVLDAFVQQGKLIPNPCPAPI